MEKIAFVVHENGRATLYEGGKILQEVDECSGLDAACKIFNSMMEKRHLSYRLQSNWPEIWKEIMGFTTTPSTSQASDSEVSRNNAET